MPSFQTTRRVRYSAAQMFDLVADVESYPQFLPLCQALRVRRRAESGEGVGTIIAEMEVGFRGIHQSFTSRVTLDRPRLNILVEYIDGPFRHMENRWSFRNVRIADKIAAEGPADDGSTVEFYISYEFRSRTLGLLMGGMFDTAFRKFAEAFERRADEVYGGQR
ncbi:MAG TPA: type II toxin-antitoxin system RatA family toxin [Beijerinckiaceae bacterium]|nr:type II toxin-antitoxin system RatA family toxin [Beijerinckiaceae bacterium]